MVAVFCCWSGWRQLTATQAWLPGSPWCGSRKQPSQRHHHHPPQPPHPGLHWTGGTHGTWRQGKHTPSDVLHPPPTLLSWPRPENALGFASKTPSECRKKKPKEKNYGIKLLNNSQVFWGGRAILLNIHHTEQPPSQYYLNMREWIVHGTYKNSWNFHASAYPEWEGNLFPCPAPDLLRGLKQNT